MKSRKHGHNFGKRYLTDLRKSQIRTARIITAVVLLPILWFIGNWIYTVNYTLPEQARAEVPVQVKEPPMKEWVLEQVKEAGIDPYKVYMLIQCESHWNDQNTNVNYHNRLGVDRGLWQLNDKFQKVSNSCAYDFHCSTFYSIKLIKAHGFSPWVCGKGL